MKSEKVKGSTKKAKMTNKAKTPHTKRIPENWMPKDCSRLNDCGRLVKLASALDALVSLREMGFLKGETIVSDEFQKDFLQKFNDNFENCVDDSCGVLFGKEGV